LSVIVQKLILFPTQALHFIPAFQTIASTLREQLKNGGFCALAHEMLPNATGDEKKAITGILIEIYEGALPE
jgi:hypothetical protein